MRDIEWDQVRQEVRVRGKKWEWVIRHDLGGLVNTVFIYGGEMTTGL